MCAYMHMCMTHLQQQHGQAGCSLHTDSIARCPYNNNLYESAWVECPLPSSLDYILCERALTLLGPCSGLGGPAGAMQALWCSAVQAGSNASRGASSPLAVRFTRERSCSLLYA